MTSTNVHRIERITTSTKTLVIGKTGIVYTRELTFTDDKGNEWSVTLFAQTLENLVITPAE